MLSVFLIQIFYYSIAAIIGGLIPWLLKASKWWMYCIIIVLSLSSAFFLTTILKTLTPSAIEIEIIEPEPGFVSDSHVLKVNGQISAFTSKFYILVHPASTDRWWVQNSPQIFGKNSLKWTAECYIGTPDLGKDEAYDLVAIASLDNTIFDGLTGRLLYPGQSLRELPLLYKSNIVTVKRAK